jgi:hypothetical protein
VFRFSDKVFALNWAWINKDRWIGQMKEVLKKLMKSTGKDR